jgi:flagellar motility protein MotE (MotC chaperone)
MNAMKVQYESRISHLEKENADMRAEKQQEKERMMRDVEALNQRLNQLQRQLDKQQVMWNVRLCYSFVAQRCSAGN